MNATFSTTLHRRTFLKDFWGISAASVWGGMPWSGRLLAEISPGSGIMRLRIDSLPALADAGGSMRFNAGPLAPVMINRAPGNIFHAMSVVCQHQGCFVPVYDSTLGHIRCACHGSRYAIDGSLLGGPALRGLDQFTTVYDGVNTLEVHVPGLAFDAQITSVSPVGGGNPLRLALTFPAAAFSEYRVYHRADLTAEPAPVPFATTSTGSATHMQIRPTATDDVTVYVDATGDRGFYSVALRISEYEG